MTESHYIAGLTQSAKGWYDRHVSLSVYYKIINAKGDIKTDATEHAMDHEMTVNSYMRTHWMSQKSLVNS